MADTFVPFTAHREYVKNATLEARNAAQLAGFACIREFLAQPSLIDLLNIRHSLDSKKGAVNLASSQEKQDRMNSALLKWFPGVGAKGLYSSFDAIDLYANPMPQDWPYRRYGPDPLGATLRAIRWNCEACGDLSKEGRRHCVYCLMAVSSLLEAIVPYYCWKSESHGSDIYMVWTPETIKACMRTHCIRCYCEAPHDPPTTFDALMQASEGKDENVPKAEVHCPRCSVVPPEVRLEELSEPTKAPEVVVPPRTPEAIAKELERMNELYAEYQTNWPLLAPRGDELLTNISCLLLCLESFNEIRSLKEMVLRLISEKQIQSDTHTSPAKK